jgi:hypothetical protein
MVRETVLIDNCAWDILENRGVDLVDERGKDLQFTVSDFGLIEIPADSHPSENAQRIGKYARAQLAALDAEPAVWFQLKDIDELTPSRGGFGELQPDGSVKGGGFLTSIEGQAYADANEHRIGGSSGVKRMGRGVDCSSIRPTSITANGRQACWLLLPIPETLKLGPRPWISAPGSRVALVTSYGKLSRRGIQSRSEISKRRW